MLLLEQIQAEAVDSKRHLPGLLQKCKVLAARLKSDRLEQWLCHESEGYPEDISVPDYRTWQAEVKGHFYGPAGEALRHAPVPALLIPEDVRDQVAYFRCRQGIAGIEETLAASPAGMLQVPVADLAVVLGANVYAQRVCTQAWIEFESGKLLDTLNAVRHRVLDFALQLWKLQPLAGELETHQGFLCAEKVNQVFRATIARAT
ncbi:MAG: hypothetical protein ACTHK7_06910 [Aureliella sp.]